MAAPTVSILLPAYNGERYLPQQLDSILSQTWQDFELLIVNDGSTDETQAVLEAYARRDSRVELVRASGNRGQKARLSELVARATGKWIAISDQDDVWAPDKTERLTRTIGSAAIAFGRSELIDAGGASLNRTLLDAIKAPWRTGDKLSLLFRPQVSAHAMIAKREIFSADVFDSAQPFDWLLSIAGQFGDGVVYEDDAVVFHRMHSSNSHNASVLARGNMMYLRPRHLAVFLSHIARRRGRLVEGLDYLAASPTVPEASRAAFDDLGQLCRSVWLQKTRTMAPRTLFSAITNALRPMAGSDDDWQTVVDHTIALTHGLHHPKTLLRLPRVP